MTEIHPTIEPQWHEFTANFIYNKNGLKPFFGWDSIIKQYNGLKNFQFRAVGKTWNAELYYQESGIEPPESDKTPDGTSIQVETIRELRIKIWDDDDPHSSGENYEDSLNSLMVHASPRWKNCGVNYPYKQLGEAVNVKVQGSNLDPQDYPTIISSAMGRAGINSDYFKQIHELSNIQDVALYVRLNKNRSGPIYAAEGPLVQISRVLQSDREGYRSLKQDNSDQQGARVPGWNNAAILDSYNIRQLFPDHNLGKEVKHYYVKSPLNRPDSDPLAHPKLEVAYQTKRTDGTLYWSNLDQFEQEAKETLYSVLDEAGMPTACGVDDPFVPDEIWTPKNEEDYPVKQLPLQEVKTRQRDIVVEYLGHKGGFTPTQKEIVDHLRTDGGEISPQELADNINRHEDTVYRNLKEMEELLYREHDHVSLTPHISDLLGQAINEAAGAIERASNAMARAKDAAERGFDEATGALLAYCEQYGIDVDTQSEAKATIRMGRVKGSEEAKKHLQELYDLWKKAGRDPIDLRLRKFQCKYEVGDRIIGTELKTLRGKVWQHVSD